MLLVLKWSFYGYSDMVKSILQLKRIAIETIAYCSQSRERRRAYGTSRATARERRETEGRESKGSIPRAVIAVSTGG